MLSGDSCSGKVPFFHGNWAAKQELLGTANLPWFIGLCWVWPGIGISMAAPGACAGSQRRYFLN